MIGIVIALIIVGFASMFAMVHSQSGTVRRIEETQLRQISADTTAQKMIDQRIDNIITVHNSSIEHYDSEIDQIIKQLNEITADIARMDQMTAQDHRDLVDIRERYILYREPKHPNGGYTGGFVCKDDIEEEHEQNDA
jgi:septal ring factor EnvC (AmiA/AmiB activator)